MPVLKNPRWEHFAQMLAQGSYMVDAYEQAGYKRNDSNSSALARKPAVQARVAEINGKKAERLIERLAVTTESLIAEAEEIRELSVEDKQYAVAMSAVKEKGVLSGKRIERSEHGEAGEFAAIEGMSVEELREFLRAEAEAIGLTLPIADGRLEEVKQLKRLKQLN